MLAFLASGTSAHCQSFIDDPVEACAAVEKARLQYLVQCGEAQPQTPSDEDLRALCRAELAMPGVAYSTTVANACLTSIQQALANCTFYSLTACVQHGTLSNGAGCQLDIGNMTCASGFCFAGGVCGKCADPSTRPPDDTNPCGCDAPLACDASNQCVTRAKEGEACVAPGFGTRLPISDLLMAGEKPRPGNCESTHLGCVDGICKRRLSVGSTCNPGPADMCDVDASCVDEKCLANWDVVSDGDVCGATPSGGSSFYTVCDPQSTCDSSDPKNKPSCERLPALGEACAVSGCQLPLACVSGICSDPVITPCP